MHYFQNEISMKVRVHEEKQIIQGEINNFNLYLSEFAKERRNLTKHEIIEKCDISLNGSTPEDKGLQVNIVTSKIRVHVSPGTIELINNIMATMTKPEQDVSLTEKLPPDYNSLWEAHEFLENDFWFIRCEEAEDALSLESMAVEPVVKDEMCMIDVPSITIVIENGVGIHTIPMLIIETSMDGRVKNWSTEMSIESSLRLTMFYYNNTLALWEPLIEPVEVENRMELLEYVPWELNFEMSVDKHLDESQDEPTTSININSKQTLELTVTKTCLDVLTTLGSDFSKAIEKEGLMDMEVHAKYVLKNDTGLILHLELANTDLVFHNANFQEQHKDNSVFFENISVDCSTPGNSCVLYPCGKVYLEENEDNKVKDVPSLLEETIKSSSLGTTEETSSQEKFITLYVSLIFMFHSLICYRCFHLVYLQIPDAQKKIQLPIHRADKRYFPIYRETNQEPWGIISEIKQERGSTIVTVRGIVQVFNHFTVPITIHRYVNGEPNLIGEVLPNEYFNVPLIYIHDYVKDLHFSITVCFSLIFLFLLILIDMYFNFRVIGLQSKV